MHTIVLELRGIPISQLRRYLEAVGGQIAADDCITGTGWQARLIPMEDYSLGLLKMEQVRLEWQGDEHAYQAIWPQIELRFIRLGG